MSLMVAEKVCGRCGHTLPLDAFYRDSTHSTGHQRACKSCQDRRRWPLVPESERKNRTSMRHSIGNLLPACRSCNYSKHHRLITEWVRR